MLRADKGTLMDTSHATCRPNYCTALERHDSAWTTLQPSHESPTDDDALPSPVAPFAGVSVVSRRAEHSTAANATLHPVNPRRARPRQRQRQRRKHSLLLFANTTRYYSLQYGHAQLFALCCLVVATSPADTHPTIRPRLPP